MKVFFTIFFSFLIFTLSFTTPFDEIKLSGVGKSSNLEIKYKSSNKKTDNAILSIADARNYVINSYAIMISNGDNLISLKEALNLPEGKYNVKRKVLTTSFIIFEKV